MAAISIITTSHFGAITNILKAKLEPVSIACNPPSQFSGRRYKWLEPFPWMLSYPPKDFFSYFNGWILDDIDPKKVIADLGFNICLLGHEPPGYQSHRQLVADWLEEKLGIEVPELGFERKNCLPYLELPEWVEPAKKMADRKARKGEEEKAEKPKPKTRRRRKKRVSDDDMVLFGKEE